MGRPTLRKNGKPLTKSERNHRHYLKRKAQLKAARAAERQTRLTQAGVDLGIHRLAVADITEADLASETVDAVITDPPYPEEDLGVYRDLGAFAMRVLKPSGWCAVLTGTMYLDRVLTDLAATGLVYRWQI